MKLPVMGMNERQKPTLSLFGLFGISQMPPPDFATEHRPMASVNLMQVRRSFCCAIKT
jgi:hypothetical protein